MAAGALRALDALGSRPRVGLLLVLVLAMAVRLAAVAATPDYDPFSDALDYDRHARSIAAGDGWPPSLIAVGSEQTAVRPPVYPIVLGGVYLVSGDSRTAGRMLGAVMGVVVVLLLFLLADAIWGRRVAFATALGAALFPPLVLLSVPLINESTFLALEVAAVLAAVLCVRARGSLGWAAAAGLFCGLAMLTRSNGTLLPLLLAPPLFLAAQGRTSRRLAAPAALLAVAALTLVPWTIRNYEAFHDFVPLNTQTGYAAAGVMNDEARGRDGVWGIPVGSARYRSLYLDPTLDEADVDKKARRLAVEYAVDHPQYTSKVAALSLLRSLEVVNTEGLREPDRRLLGLGPGGANLVKYAFWLSLGLAAYGAFALKRRYLPERGPLWIWAVPLVLFVAGATVVGLARYRAPLYPFLPLLAAIGAVAFLERRVTHPRPRAGS